MTTVQHILIGLYGAVIWLVFGVTFLLSISIYTLIFFGVFVLILATPVTVFFVLVMGKVKSKTAIIIICLLLIPLSISPYLKVYLSSRLALQSIPLPPNAQNIKKEIPALLLTDHKTRAAARIVFDVADSNVASVVSYYDKILPSNGWKNCPLVDWRGNVVTQLDNNRLFYRNGWSVEVVLEAAKVYVVSVVDVDSLPISCNQQR